MAQEQEQNKVQTSRISLDELVQRVDPEDVQIVYYFSNGRTFEDSGDNNGIYEK